MAGFFRYADTLSAHPNFHQMAALLDQVDTRPMELGEEGLFEGGAGIDADKSQIAALDIEHLHISVSEGHPNISDSLRCLVLIRAIHTLFLHHIIYFAIERRAAIQHHINSTAERRFN